MVKNVYARGRRAVRAALTLSQSVIENIPMFFVGKEFEKGKELENVSILDLNVAKAKEWEGKSLVSDEE